jgi:hypothetical protein
MRAKYKLILCFFTASLSFAASASNFLYSSVVLCGPVGVKSWSDDKHPDIGAHKYFYIHKSKDKKIVVWNDFYQYTNFNEITYPHIWTQNGGITSLNYSAAEGIEKYVLSIKNFANSGRTHMKTLLVDLSSGTFISRVAGFDPTMGVCNPIEK